MGENESMPAVWWISVILTMMLVVNAVWYQVHLIQETEIRRLEAMVEYCEAVHD